MKLLYLMSYASPEKAASNYLGKNRNQAFTDRGWDIQLYVPTPSRGLTKDVIKEYRKKEHRLEHNYDGHMTIHRFRVMPEGTNPLLRAMRYFSVCLKLFNRGLFSKDARGCDLMFTNSTPPIQGAMAALLSKFNHKPLVYNLQDIFPDSLVGTGMTHKGSFLWKVGRKIENFTYRNADRIIVISQDFKKNIMAKGVPEDKIAVIYNWVDQDAVVDIPREENKLFDKYGLDRSKFYITYSGNIGLTQNMDMLLEVAGELQTEAPDIRFVLVGEGAYKEKAEQIVKEGGIGNVTFIPFQPYEDISHVFSLGDAGLVISKPGVGANSVPSKTWSIMSASRPVLANFDENELKDIIADNSCGIFTAAGDKEAFKQSILTLYANRELCREYGSNGRRFIMNNLTKEVGTAKYVDVIKSFIK